MSEDNDMIDLTSEAPAASVAPKWRTSTYSALLECVEVTCLDGTVGVRNKRDPSAGLLIIPRAAFGAWLDGIKAGELDDLVP